MEPLLTTADHGVKEGSARMVHDTNDPGAHL